MGFSLIGDHKGPLLAAAAGVLARVPARSLTLRLWAAPGAESDGVFYLQRVLLSTGAAFCSLCGVAALYVYLLGAAAPPGQLALPALSPAQLLALAAATALLVMAPFDALALLAVRSVGAGAAAARDPGLMRDLACRRAGAGALAGLHFSRADRSRSRWHS
jgi:hypothetical protein